MKPAFVCIVISEAKKSTNLIRFDKKDKHIYKRRIKIEMFGKKSLCYEKTQRNPIQV